GCEVVGARAAEEAAPETHGPKIACGLPTLQCSFPPHARLAPNPISQEHADGPQAPHGVLEVDWPFFGELCRALALKVFRGYDPDVVIGIARAGVIPGAVVASILQRDFASVAITRTESGERRVELAGAPRFVAGTRVMNV